MTPYNHEKYLSVIHTIGEQKVEELYALLGPEKISMATLRQIIFKQKLQQQLQCKLPVSKLAAISGVSRMTIYRSLKKSNRS